jgi:GLPGLI family protein
MKLLLPIFFLTISLVRAQGESASYEVIYLSSSLYETTYRAPDKEFTTLYYSGQKAVYQKHNQRKKDSISLVRKLTNEDIGKYKCRERYAIEFNGNEITYYDELGNDEFQYTETLDHNWKLGSESKTLKGYKCRNATVSYGGRDWIAWYATELPINAGPYKFRGLPGLIVKITDATNSYDFELYSVKEKSNLTVTKSYHSKSFEERKKLTRDAFNKYRFYWNLLSFNERLAVMNGQPGATISFTSSDGGTSPFDQPRNVNLASTLNLIEIDHE